MSIARRIRSFRAASPLERRLFFAALLLTPFFRVALALLPFRRVLAWQGLPRVESPDAPDPSSLAYRTALHGALLRCARYAPRFATCYALCLAGKVLLRRRGLPSTLYVGFRKTEAGRHEGHAWLRSHDTWVSGGGRRRLYHVHSQYT
jgi:hypothetical protein